MENNFVIVLLVLVLVVGSACSSLFYELVVLPEKNFEYNDLIQKNDKEKELLIFENNKKVFELETNYKDLNIIKNTLKKITMDCYWATQFYANPKGMIEKFEDDYTIFYAHNCIQKANDFWDYIKGE